MAHVLRFSVLQQGRVGEVLFSSNIDSSRRKQATNGECKLKTRGCEAVRCVRSGKGGFIRWFLDNLGYHPPEVDTKTKTKGGALWR